MFIFDYSNITPINPYTFTYIQSNRLHSISLQIRVNKTGLETNVIIAPKPIYAVETITSNNDNNYIIYIRYKFFNNNNVYISSPNIIGYN